MHPKPVIGLIGGIGSGKSFVAGLLAQRGGRIVSGDLAGHEALRDPAIKEHLVGRWGREILDDKGEISRRKVGAIVFGNPEERQALEATVFPWIKARLKEWIDAAMEAAAARFVVLDAAIMIEAGWSEVCDWIVYVHAPRSVRLRRLAERGWSEKEVEARESAQMSLTDKVSRADFAVVNVGCAEETCQQVDRLLQDCLNSGD